GDSATDTFGESMARIDVLMPQMGESIAEGTVSKWLKKVGEEVKRDEPLFEISTDKVDAEIPSPVAGVLAEIKVQEGQTVAVQTLVGVIETEKGAAAVTAPAPSPPSAPPPPSAPAQRAPAAPGGAVPVTAAGARARGGPPRGPGHAPPCSRVPPSCHPRPPAPSGTARTHGSAAPIAPPRRCGGSRRPGGASRRRAVAGRPRRAVLEDPQDHRGSHGHVAPCLGAR